MKCNDWYNSFKTLQSAALIFPIHQMGELVREVTDQETELRTSATATMSLLVHHQGLVKMMAHGLEMPQLANVQVRK